MSPEEVYGLLETAAMYDGREPSEDYATWQRVADAREWTFDEVEQQIHDHYGAGTEYLTPDMIKMSWSPGDGPNPTGPPASQEGIDEAVDIAATKLGWQNVPERRALLSVACPFCSAEGGQKCRRPTRTTGTGWMRVEYFHGSRYEAAGLPAPDDSERAAAARVPKGGMSVSDPPDRRSPDRE